MTVFASGISMDAWPRLLHQLLGWNYHVSLWICSAVVLVYVLKGGLTSAIYTEVLQFFMIVLGLRPGGLPGPEGRGRLGHAQGKACRRCAEPGRDRTWHRPSGARLCQRCLDQRLDSRSSQGPADNPMGVDVFAMVFGLGFVLSFGYWCTNFLVIQRAMAAET